MTDAVVIERRFRGPPDSGNGGYSCGIVGTRIDGPAEVTLRVPPPLDRPLRIEAAEGGLALLDGETRVAEAAPSRVEVDVLPPVAFDEARDAAERALAHQDDHPFPMCFVCGPDRGPGDGLRIFPGSIPGRTDIVAAPWVPDETLPQRDGAVTAEIVWAALDCPGGIGGFVTGGPPVDALMLLGRMATRIDRLPVLGERCVLTGWRQGPVDGRKLHAGSALFGENGDLYAVSRQTWIALKR